MMLPTLLLFHVGHWQLLLGFNNALLLFWLHDESGFVLFRSSIKLQADPYTGAACAGCLKDGRKLILAVADMLQLFDLHCVHSS